MTSRCFISGLLIALGTGVLIAHPAIGQTVDSTQRLATDSADTSGLAPQQGERAAPRAVIPGGDHVGLAIAFLGDVDRDGKSELLIGAYGNDSAAGDAGAVFVIAGSSGDTLLTLFGRAAHDNFGASVAALGDLDGDFVPDFAVGAPGMDDAEEALPDLGGVYLYSGVDGHLIDSLFGLHAQGQYGYVLARLGDLDGDGVSEFGVGERRGADSARPNFSTVFICSGRTRETIRVLEGVQSGDRFGFAMAGVGNADRTNDVVVGAYRFSSEVPSAGATYLYSGTTGALIRTKIGLLGLGHFGYAVADAGDLDLDRRGDILVGARFDDAAGGRAGKVFALSGADGRVLFTLPGTADAQFGSSVSGTGDLDGDGRPDLAVGAPKSAPNGAGAVHLYSGADGRLLGTLTGAARGDNFGGTVAGGEDANGDGIPDIAVGALGSDDGGVDAGKVYVYSGRDRSLIQSFTGRSGVTAKDTARVARVKEAVQAIRKAGDTLTLPDTIYDSTQVDVMPILRRSVNAEYPETAMGSGLSGWVQVRILVLADGAPGKVDIADDAGLGPDFRLAALTAARQWFFLPATKGGEAVAAWTVFPIGFAPDEARRSAGAADSAGGVTRLDSLRRAASDSAAAGVADSAGKETQRVAQGEPGADSSQAGSPSRPDTLASTDSGSMPPPPADSAAGPPDAAGALSSSGSGSSEMPDSALPVIDSGLTGTLPAGRKVEVDLSRLYEISDVDIVPVLVAKVDPQYPAAARLAGDTATVLVRLMVDTLGAVARFEVKLCTVPGRGFEESATAAVRRWRFEPAKRVQHKVNCWVEYPLEFRI